MRRLAGIVIGLGIGLVAAYLSIIGYMYFNQRNLQYAVSGEVTALADSGIVGGEEVTIAVADGAEVHGWFAPARAGQPTIVYYKGNSGSFSAEHERFAQFAADGYGFLAIDYRGFPLSPGALSEASVLEDAIAAYDYAASRSETLMIWGRSLGSGPATYVAGQRDAAALLLETPFLSAVNVAAERYPYLPVHWVMQDQYRVDEWITAVSEPVVIVHGTADTVIDFSNGQRLYALVPNPVELLVFEDGTHGDLWDRGLWTEASRFFASEAR